MTPFFGGKDRESALRDAAWVARCVGRPETAPLTEPDISALASYLTPRGFDRGAPVFPAGKTPAGVWIVRAGIIELVAGSGRRKTVVQLMHPGEVDGDVELLLDMPLPYSARALTETRTLFLNAAAFEELLFHHPAVARRWLSSIATRLSTSQKRIVMLLGKPLTEQVARLLLDEAVNDVIPLPQRTLAAMLGVQRPSLNKVLKEFEQRGLVEVGYAEVKLQSREVLERIAASPR